MAQDSDQTASPSPEAPGTDGGSAGEQPTAGASDSATKVAELTAKVQELEDRALRFQAEMENSRKRAQREANDMIRYAAMPLIRDILPVLDNVSLALNAAERTAVYDEKVVLELLTQFAGQPATAAQAFLTEHKARASTSLLTGFRMLVAQLQQALQQSGCQRIETLQKPFDPNLHEAISQMPSAEHPPLTVLQEVRAGFQLHDRVVRPAQVIVASAPAAS